MYQEQIQAQNYPDLPFGFFQVSQRIFFYFQFITVTFFVAMATIHYVYGDVNGHDWIWHATRIFDPKFERNIPTAFSSFNLLLSSVLLFVIYWHSKCRSQSIGSYWLCLSVIMFLLSLDEIAGFHERIGKLQNFTGVLIPMIETHSWVLYGAIFVLTVFLFFCRFLLELDRQTAALFVLSGAVFVSGALGFETLGAWMLHNEIVVSKSEIIFLIRRVFEEGFEMYGIAIFNCVLIAYITTHKVSFTFTSRA